MAIFVCGGISRRGFHSRALSSGQLGLELAWRYLSVLCPSPCSVSVKRSALRFEFLAHDGSASAECLQLAAGDFTGERGHAAVGAGVELVGIHELQRLTQGLGDFFRRLDGVVGDVDELSSSLVYGGQKEGWRILLIDHARSQPA